MLCISIKVIEKNQFLSIKLIKLLYKIFNEAMKFNQVAASFNFADLIISQTLTKDSTLTFALMF